MIDTSDADKRLVEIKSIADDDIDTSDIPEADASFFERARWVLPQEPTSIAATPTASAT